MKPLVRMLANAGGQRRDEPGREFEEAAARFAPDVPVRVLAPGEALTLPPAPQL